MIAMLAPEVAHVGYTEDWAKSEGLFVEAVIVDLKNNDRAKAEDDMAGFLKLVVGKKSKLIGATLVGSKAGDMIPIATIAIKQNLAATAFMGMIFSYPTQSEIFMLASLEKVKDSFKAWQKKLIKLLFLR